jgi:hypothetical protein
VLYNRSLYAARAISQSARYTIHVATTAIDFLVYYSHTPDEEEKEQRRILTTTKAIAPALKSVMMSLRMQRVSLSTYYDSIEKYEIT